MAAKQSLLATTLVILASYGKSHLIGWKANPNPLQKTFPFSNNCKFII